MERTTGKPPLLSLNRRRWRLTPAKAITEDVADFIDFRAKLAPLLRHLPDYYASITRLANAIEQQEIIGISSDYDCDGNGSMALLLRVLSSCGVSESHLVAHIPNRFSEGYGINDQAVNQMAQQGVTLLLTLDNGTLAHRPLAQARAKRMDIIVADHHPNQEGEPLPMEALIVNPNRTDAVPDPSMKALAAVGVTYLLCLGVIDELQQRGYFARHNRPVPPMEKQLGLVALSTVADVVNVSGWINRFFIKRGLEIIRNGEDPVLSQLCEAAHLSPQTLTEEHMAFTLGPIVNAPGRLNHPQDAEWHDAPEPWRLLSSTTDSRVEIATHFLRMKTCNDVRKQKETNLYNEARAQAEALLQRDPDAKVIVVGGSGPEWHPGIVGIVASRLMEQFGLPTVVAAYDEKKQHYKMSARSIRATSPQGLISADIGEAFRYEKSQHRLAHGGGHPFAAGATLECTAKDRAAALEAFRLQLNARLSEQVDAVKMAQRTEVSHILDLATLKATTGIFADAEMRERALRFWLRDQPRQAGMGMAQLAARLTGQIHAAEALKLHDNQTDYAILDDLIAQDCGTARAQALAAIEKAEPQLLHHRALRDLSMAAKEQGPFGEGHRPPLYALPDMIVHSVSETQNGKHLLLMLAPRTSPQLKIKAQAFHVSPELREALQLGQGASPEPLTLLATLEISGKGNIPEFRIEDAHRCPHRGKVMLTPLSDLIENYPASQKMARGATTSRAR